MEIRKYRHRKFTESDMQKLAKVLQENRIFRTTSYHTFRQIHGNQFDGLPLPSNPWQMATMSAKEFFSCIVSGGVVEKSKGYNPHYKYKKIPRKSLEEHLQLARDNKLYHINDFVDLVRKMGKPCEYYTYPWHVFKLQVTEFFNLAFCNYKQIIHEERLRLCATSDLDHVTLCMENGLTNSKKYREFYLQHREARDMLSRPWDRYCMSEKQFFDAIRANNIHAFVREK